MLPKKLKKSPIVDAVFDIRIDTSSSLAISIPGLILQRYPEAKVKKLPGFGVPEQVMLENPHLRYVATLQIELGDGGIFLCGEKVLAVGYTTPYPGWEVFNTKIKELLSFLSRSESSTAVERVAIKYVDLIDKALEARVQDVTTFCVSLNNNNLTDSDFSFRVSSSLEKVDYVLQLVSNASIGNKSGIIIDSDTILDLKAYYKDETVCVKKLLDDFSAIEYLHEEAKKVFFSAISKSGLELLGAEYGE